VSSVNIQFAYFVAISRLPLSLLYITVSRCCSVAFVNSLVDSYNANLHRYAGYDNVEQHPLHRLVKHLVYPLSKQRLKYICISVSPTNHSCFYIFQTYISEKSFSCWLHLKISTAHVFKWKIKQLVFVRKFLLVLRVYGK